MVSFTGPVAFDTVKCYLYLGVNLASPAYASVHVSATSPGPASLALTGSWVIPNTDLPPVSVSFECQSLEFTDTTDRERHVERLGRPLDRPYSPPVTIRAHVDHT